MSYVSGRQRAVALLVRIAREDDAGYVSAHEVADQFSRWEIEPPMPRDPELETYIRQPLGPWEFGSLAQDVRRKLDTEST